MDELKIKQRLAALQSEKAAAALRVVQAEKELEHAKGSLTAFDGALQDCAYWLQQVQQDKASKLLKKNRTTIVETEHNTENGVPNNRVKT